MKDRVDLLCQLIELECVSAVNAAPCVSDRSLYATTMRVCHHAMQARESWSRAILPEGLDVAERPRTREQRDRLLEALTDPASMGAYGAPVELGPDTPAGPMLTLPAGWACVPPAPGFDREAFRRDVAARVIASISADPAARWELHPHRLAETALDVADALLARLEQKPEDRG